MSQYYSNSEKLYRRAKLLRFVSDIKLVFRNNLETTKLSCGPLPAHTHSHQIGMMKILGRKKGERVREKERERVREKERERERNRGRFL